jgi:Cu2+-exporting ATPase
MDSVILTAAVSVAVPSQTGCYHCGMPLPHGGDLMVAIDGVERAMCCAGCQAVAQTIVDYGLTSYYRHRSALPSREETVPQAVRDLAAYDVPEVERTLSRNAGGTAREAALMLEGITCAACVWLIEQRIARMPGVLDIDINYATHRAQVRWDARRTRLAAILEAVAAIGYRASAYDSARAEQARRRERDRALWRLFIAGFGMMQVMMYLVPVYLTDGEMTADIEQLMRIASLILTLPVVLFSAAPFFAGAWRDARARHLGMDVPIALGIGTAFAASVVATVTGSGQVYFDSVTMFVFLLLAARYLEMTARARAAMTQERLAQQAPAVAERFAEWPESDLAEMVAVNCLRVGDYLRVRPGAAVPADGVVVDGASEFDERLLTGESRPRPRRVGDDLTGGSLNVGNPLVLRVTRIGAATVLAGILRLLDRAAGEKPRIARSADRIAQHFVLALLIIAAMVAAVWYQLDAARALWVTVAVLVVSCPCALSLATPTALAAATGTLHAHGVLITRGDALESLAHATDFVFDKTGTLTTGEMRLVGVIPLALAVHPGEPGRDECLALAAALESGSGHPIARAITAAAPAGAQRSCSEVKHIAGSGVEATIDGVRWRLGTPPFVAALNGLPFPRGLALVADDITVVALGDERGWIGLFMLTDPLRPHARMVVSELTRLGKRVHLLSGDRPQIACHIAHQLGISAVLGGATPCDKLDYVQCLQRDGAVVAMVGDGVNDAAGLAASQVSIAMGGGADIACSASDVILLSGRLDALLVAVRTACATLRIIRQNLAWAFAYNLVAIPLAACGYVTPLLAGAGMAASSMLVVANALRLLRHAPPQTTSMPASATVAVN